MTGPSLVRLTRVELRKALDTRAGLWLHLATAALIAVVAVVRALTIPAGEVSWSDELAAAVQPAVLLLPIAGILLMSSEWTQRTALITFTLVPQRSRVIAAKVLAAVAVAAGAFVLCLAVSGLVTAIVSSADDAFSLPVGLVAQVALYVATSMVTGVAFGAALLTSAPAIVLYYVLPLTWAAAGTLAFLEPTARWLDGTRTVDPLTDRLFDGGDWAHAAATLAVWMLVPLAIGTWRIVRGEVRVG
jgi:ABC-2 type transport system permease protein